MTAIEGLTEGRIVHFVMNNGEHRPAIIVKVWNKETGVSNLQVFTDGSNDRRQVSGEESTAYNDAVDSGILWRTSILPSFDDPQPNTWHWIEKA